MLIMIRDYQCVIVFCGNCNLAKMANLFDHFTLMNCTVNYTHETIYLLLYLFSNLFDKLLTDDTVACLIDVADIRTSWFPKTFL